MYTKKAAAVAVCCVLASGCADVRKEDIGALVGALAGAAVGSTIGDGGGQAAAMVAGFAIGGIAGTLIGRELDEADRVKAELAARQAASASTAERVNWTSEKNGAVSGYAEPVSPARVHAGDLCKDVKSVYVIDGEEKSEVNRFCFRNGQWENA